MVKIPVLLLAAAAAFVDALAVQDSQIYQDQPNPNPVQLEELLHGGDHLEQASPPASPRSADIYRFLVGRKGRHLDGPAEGLGGIVEDAIAVSCHRVSPPSGV